MSTIERFRALQDEAFEKFKKKNADYGDNFREEGALGVFVRIKDKLSRTINLIRKRGEKAVADEALRDTLIDNSNYSLMAVLAQENGAPLGDPPGTKTIIINLTAPDMDIDYGKISAAVGKHMAQHDTVRIIMKRIDLEQFNPGAALSGPLAPYIGIDHAGPDSSPILDDPYRDINPFKDVRSLKQSIAEDTGIRPEGEGCKKCGYPLNPFMCECEAVAAHEALVSEFNSVEDPHYEPLPEKEEPTL